MTSSLLRPTTPPSVDRVVPEPARTDAWSRLERFAFRFVFVYFAMFALGALLDVGNGPRALLAALSGPPVRWFAHTVFHLVDPAAVGGPAWAAAQQIVAFAIAAAVASVWSLLAHRTEYRRLRGWFFTVMRYYVAIIMMIYGGFKIVDSQFPPLSLEQLAQPLGSLKPMGLLWAFMGYSSIYASFTGLGEAAGAFLLFFRRTTTAGALILIAVLSNVALLNYTFDVPVKQLSFNLLLASITLAAADVKRIADVLLFNRAVAPADQSFDFRQRWIYRVRRFLKPVIVVAATCGPLGFSIVVHSNIVRPAPLYGVYRVESFVRDGVLIAPTTTESTRWRDVVFGRAGILSVRMMNDTTTRFIVAVDSVAHRLTIRAGSRSAAPVVFEYERVASGLRLWGVLAGERLDVTVRQLDHEQLFPLLKSR